MPTLTEIPVKRIDGAATTLDEFRGKVMLIVNVASKCGLTKQYEGLEAVYREHRDAGFVVLGFPANDFAGQEPGSNDEIAQFCSTKFDVDFPLFEKISVTGAGQHPLYKALTEAVPTAISKPGTDFRKDLEGYGIKPNPVPEVLWNFEKFLIGRDGKVAARFSPDVTPDDPIVEAAIAKAIAAPA
ncbi:glutathione peroxidase [soil metagenome]